MSDLNRVLELLYDRGEGFFAIEELTAASGLSRARLEEVLESVRHRGHELEFSPGHGVRLARPMRLEAHLIQRELGTQRVGRHVICFEEVDSTNDVAFDSARQARAEFRGQEDAQGDPDGLAVLAEFQRRGRGRLGRRWLSPPEANVLMSVLLIDSESKLAHEALTIAAGLAVSEGVESACGLETQLRWPNDVLVDGKKAAGILVELRTVAETRAVVIGVGINANWAPAADVDALAVSLAEELGHPVERIEIVRAVLRRLDQWTRRVEAEQLEELHSVWLARCGMLNERITVVCGGKRYVGRALDVSPLEGLILSCDDGQRLHLPAESSTVLVLE